MVDLGKLKEEQEAAKVAAEPKKEAPAKKKKVTKKN